MSMIFDKNYKKLTIQDAEEEATNNGCECDPNKCTFYSFPNTPTIINSQHQNIKTLQNRTMLTKN